MSDRTPQEKQPEKDVKLKLAGASYMLGDAAMMLAGKIRGEQNVIAGGATWFLGGVGAAVYGNPDSDRQMKILSSRLENHLKKKGVTIPADVRGQSELLKEKSFWDNIENFLYSHPSEILNGAYAIGATMLLHGGMKELSSKSKTLLPKSFNLHAVDTMSTQFWMGGIILAGALAGLLIKEDPEAKKKAENGNIVDKVVAFATEKPLRVSGALYTLNNGFLAATALQDWHAAKTTYAGHNFKPHYFSTLQLACYLFSNAMLLMSPREQVNKDGFGKSEIAQLEEAAAQIIAAQPKEVQGALIADMSQFMSKQAGIKLKPEQIETQLTEHLNNVTTTSPAERRFAAREAQRAAVAAEQSKSI